MDRVRSRISMNNEVYYTNALILLVKIILCSKLHCIKVLNINPFSLRLDGPRAFPDLESQNPDPESRFFPRLFPPTPGHKSEFHVTIYE